MRALFLGSAGPYVAQSLRAWLNAGHEIAEFWYPASLDPYRRRRDRRTGWVAPEFSVHATLRHFGLPSRPVTPLRKSPELQTRACQIGADVLISSCFAYLVPPAVLKHFGRKAVNLHPAMLPRYRGAGAIAWMLYNEDAHAHGGVTLHVMSEGFDEGDIIAQQHTPWPAGGGFRLWEIQLSRAAASLVASDLPRYLRGESSARPQLGESRYYRSLNGRLLRLDDSLSAGRMRYLLETIGSYQPLYVDLPGTLVRVAAFDRLLGRPCGEPPRCGPCTVSLDASDARVRLRRWQPWTSRYRKTRTLLLHASHAGPRERKRTRLFRKAGFLQR
jgi:methionyl-tRNA formyltransferase